MQEVVSFREPFWFAAWGLVFAIFYYITTRSLLKEKHWHITIPNTIMLVIYMYTKFFDKISFPVCTIISLIIGVITVILTRKKYRPFKTVACLFLPHVLALFSSTLCGIVNEFTLVYDREKLYGNLEVYEDYVYIYLIDLLFITTTALFLSGIIKLIINRKSDLFNFTLKYLFFLWMPISHLVTYIFIYSIIMKGSDENHNLVLLPAIVMVIILLFDFLTFLMVEKYEKVERNNIEYEKELIQAKLDYQKTILVKENEAELRKVRHDILNILSTARGFIEIGKHEKALTILQSTTDNLTNVQGVPICSNDTINAMLSIKASQAKEAKIKLNININEETALSINDYDLCRVIGNLIDNAINAVKNTDSLSVDISMSITQEIFTIITENKYSSALPKSAVRDSSHGNGKGIIKDIIKNYNGSYVCETIEDKYRTTTILCNTQKK